MKPASLGQAVALKATTKALLCRVEDRDDEEIWIPLSQIHGDSEVWGEDDEGELIISEWWAEKEDLV